MTAICRQMEVQAAIYTYHNPHVHSVDLDTDTCPPVHVLVLRVSQHVKEVILRFTRVQSETPMALSSRDCIH